MNNKSKKGFTLLEVMLSLSIISISLMVIIQSFSYAIVAKNSVSKYTQAMFLAQEKLFDLSISPIEQSDNEGVFKDQFEGFKWQITSGRTDFSDLAKVDLTINWMQRGKLKNLQITTIMEK